MSKKKELEIESQLLHEEVLLKADDTISKYNNPEVISYVVENRNNNKTFKQIAEELQLRGYEGITSNKVSEIHAKALARSVVEHHTAQESFADYTHILLENFQQAVELLSMYIKNLRKLNEEFDKLKDDEGNIDLLKAKLAIAKTIPTAVALLREIREYTKFHADLQDKITKTVDKEVVWSSAQMLDYINKYLKTLEKNGQIKIIDEALKQR